MLPKVVALMWCDSLRDRLFPPIAHWAYRVRARGSCRFAGCNCIHAANIGHQIQVVRAYAGPTHRLTLASGQRSPHVATDTEPEELRNSNTESFGCHRFRAVVRVHAPLRVAAKQVSMRCALGCIPPSMLKQKLLMIQQIPHQILNDDLSIGSCGVEAG